MPHLHDMEELVNSIEDDQAKDYMKEAMSCYMASAYRACIVLTYIALFDDIIKKLGELSNVNGKARKIYNEAQKKINSQDVYESYVIDQLQSNSLLPSLDTSFLETLRTLRNKSAHPSGHNASAEEARFIFYEAINRFLSKPVLTTTQLVNEILARLDEQHFFPSSDIKKISDVVNKELENIHHESIPYLIIQFSDKTLNTNAVISKNAGFFLTGYAYLKRSEHSHYIKKHLINAKCSDSKYSELILRVISADGSLVLGLDPITYERLALVISDRIRSVDRSLEHTRLSHPSSVFKSILGDAGEDFLMKKLRPQLVEFFKKNIFSSNFLSSIKGCQEVINIYTEEANDKAGSNDFDVANQFSRNVKDVDIYLSSYLPAENVFQIIVNILQAADNGAWGAQALRNANFSSIPRIKEIVAAFVTSNYEKAEVIYLDVIGNTEEFSDQMDQYILCKDT